MNRTAFLWTLAATVPIGKPPSQPASFAAEERRTRGRLGVSAIDLRDDRRIGRREHERFPLASTFKLPLVMDVLARVDGGIERLDRTISFGPREIIAYSPVLAKQPRGGSLTVADLCAAAIERSDNAAANLLLATLGGPRGVTRRSPGRLDRRGQDRHDEHRRQRRRSVVRRFRP